MPVKRVLLSCLVLLAASASSVAAEPAQIIVNGQTRTYHLQTTTGQGPSPTVLMLHGGGSTAEQEMRLSGLAQLGPREGFTAVFPDAIGRVWSFFPPGKETSEVKKHFQVRGGPPDDVSFLKALVADLVHKSISDPKRIYLGGRSLGGVMALRLACLDAETFAAVGLLIASMPDAIGSDCNPSKPVPLLTINGTRDLVLPYRGERIVKQDVLWSTQRLVDFFKTLNGCAEPAEQSPLAGQGVQNVVIEHATGCVGGPVVFYRIVGGQHEIPPTLKASQALLDFFRDKTR